MSTEAAGPAPLAGQAPSTIRNTIVIGVDGSESSKQALRWAHSLAQTTSSQLQAVAAWLPYNAYGWGYGMAVPTDWNPAGEARKGIDETIDAVFGSQRPAGMEIEVREGSAASVLLELSQDARMLVVGSRGYGGFTGLLMGSVSSACAEHGSCPVLVVHGSTPPPSAS